MRYKIIITIVFLAVITRIGIFFIENNRKPEHKQSFTFIWNSDDEGLPPIGEEVIIEDIKGDSIWLVAPMDYSPVNK
jgi:hypothetical protein